MIFRRIRSAIRLTIFVLWSLLLIVIQTPLLMVTRGPAAYVLPQIWHIFVCWLMGLKIIVEGQPAYGDKPVLFVGNHVSYLDIPVLGKVLRASFIAKKEVGSWLLFGILSKLQQTYYIDRTRSAAANEVKGVDEFIRQNKNLILFAEGTNTDGLYVKNFKSSLFTLAENNPHRFVIQPFTIVVLEIDNKPVTDYTQQCLYAWVGEDNNIMNHLPRFTMLSGASVKIIFHAPVSFPEGADRKKMAEICHNIVSGPINALPKITPEANNSL
ncbi:MAG: 1-acyl-sn-glycerol-3-phosphate acyltransferase [Alphaproteobacteria bacterium]|nr:1-acyl-sn-glycerol-3-phosphate acyltransferase [Alphaproteobacteria bacterium]